ncbi:unnamed protein product [Amoebophrya sp. A25]|nr:unnamed protein product [Amoebophrya sp. A25]|eukprot:GSA25T00014453001.1
MLNPALASLTIILRIHMKISWVLLVVSLWKCWTMRIQARIAQSRMQQLEILVFEHQSHCLYSVSTLSFRPRMFKAKGRLLASTSQQNYTTAGLYNYGA